MSNVIDIRSKVRVVEAPKDEVYNIEYTEKAQEDNFAMFLVHVAGHLPVKSKRQFIDGLQMMESICHYAVVKRDYKLCKALQEMGFIDSEIVGGMNAK